MADAVAPALSPDEWAAGALPPFGVPDGAGGFARVSVVLVPDDDGPGRQLEIRQDGAAPVRIPAIVLPGLIALANAARPPHDPGKILPGDARGVAWAAARVREVAATPAGVAADASLGLFLGTLAATLGAMLPPEP